jgi:predicted nucleic acid-binding protein
VLAATTRAEILVGPSRVGGKMLTAARDFADGCETVPVSAAIADDAAGLKAHHRGLSLPDAIALVVADIIDAGGHGCHRRSSAPAGLQPLSAGADLLQIASELAS